MNRLNYYLIFFISIGFLYSCKQDIKNQISEVKVEKKSNVISKTETRINADKSIIYNLKFGCGYDKEIKKREEMIISPASDRCQYIISKIMSFNGLNPNFEVFEINDNNASAVIIENKRLILYDKNLLNFSDYASESYWSSISILAHEVGHHLSGHTLDIGQDSHKNELEADKFSGFVLYKMGASLIEAQKAMLLLGTEIDSESHPNRMKRLQAIEKGWNEANGQKYVSAIPPPPVDDNETFQRDEFNYDEITSDYFQEYLEGAKIRHPDYFKGFVEGVIIDIEEIDARHFSHYSGYDQYNIAVNIEITGIDYPENHVYVEKAGDRAKFHMINYGNTANAGISWIEKILTPGRKIRFKSYYFGYGAEDIYYIKKLDRSVKSNSKPISSTSSNPIEIITSFLVAEEDRDIYDISSYYSSSPQRYYNLTYPSKQQIIQQYERAWERTRFSINNIRTITKRSDYVFDLNTQFTFLLNSGERKSINSVVRFVFNDNFKIIETFNP